MIGPKISLPVNRQYRNSLCMHCAVYVYALFHQHIIKSHVGHQGRLDAPGALGLPAVHNISFRPPDKLRKTRVMICVQDGAQLRSRIQRPFRMRPKRAVCLLERLNRGVLVRLRDQNVVRRHTQLHNAITIK
jgi:hypothetical protein